MEDTPHQVHFQELMEPQSTSIWNGRQVRIYGFIHPHPEKEWVLSSQAQLRSCCTLKSLQEKTSIHLMGQLSNPKVGHVTLLQGTLLAQNTQEGTFWTLQNPSVIEQQARFSSAEWAWGLLGISLVTALLIYFFYFTCTRLLKKS